jgi:hypothetical protein
MKWLDSIGKLFILAAAAVIILWLLLDRVHCNGTKGISEKQHKDAIMKALDSAHQEWQSTEDSLITSSEKIEDKVDSLKEAKRKSDSKLRVYMDKTAELAAEVIRARIAGDTTIFMDKCDSLAHLVEGLNFSIAGYTWTIDSLTAAQDELVKTNKTRAEESAKLIKRLRDSALTLSLLFDDVHSKYQRALKKASKKYSISASAGYGIAPQTNFMPFVGITFSRTLIRF